MKKNAVLIGSIAALALMVSAAGAYFIGNAKSNPEKPAQMAAAKPPMQQAQVQPPPCNDHNIVGTGLGAVAGGVIGSQFGSGSGKTAATIGGAVAGGAIGHEAIPTQNVTCR